MSDRSFKRALIILSLLALIAIGSMFSSVAQRPMTQSDINRLAEQLVSRVTSISSKAITACHSIAPPAKCEEIRKEVNRVTAEIGAAKRDNPTSLGGWSHLIDKWEIETAPMLRDMETSAKFIEDFPRRIIDACKNLPTSDPSRPPPATCIAMLSGR